MPSFYCIRHKASGELMPTLKNGRGYTYWNPLDSEWSDDCSTKTPRLFLTLEHAKGVVAKWAGYRRRVYPTRPLATFSELMQHTSVVDPDFVVRKSSELEIIEIDLRIINDRYQPTGSS